MGNRRIQEVAILARTFRQDPIMMLDDSGDLFRHLVRLACLRYVVEQEEAAQNRAERQAKSKSR